MGRAGAGAAGADLGSCRYGENAYGAVKECDSNVLHALIAFWLWQSNKKPTRDTCIFLGLSDSGKTTIFTKLQYGKPLPTCTSMSENEAKIVLKSRAGEPLHEKLTHVVDVPGAEKLRFRWTELVPITKSIVFISDASSFSRNTRPVAEFLYDVLVNRHTSKLEIPVLILCNKQDLITAYPSAKIQDKLETEINQLRSTRTAAVESQDDDTAQDQFLGYENETFNFSHLPNSIQFVPFSSEGDDGIEELQEFLSR
ncbi:signal recognition particle receptor beta subunit-domain-containing protein [Cladochytrium replicatum]|nr:signal recognition particle receptor beta subunit-domain-containing protein [Cladochytrium replicatum]